MKLMLRDPIPLEELRRKLQQLGVSLTAEWNDWLVQHGNHSGLVLSKEALYCRSCKAKVARGPAGKVGTDG